MPKHLVPTLLAGFLSGVLFLATSRLGLGFVFMFLPTLPLLTLRLGAPTAPALAAALLAASIATFAGGLGAGLLFLLLFGLPSCYVGRLALLWRPGNHESASHCFPVGLIVLRLTLSACALIAFVVLGFALQHQSVPVLLSQFIRDTFADAGDEYRDAIDTLAGQWSFLIFSMTVWLWGLAMYAHAWVANRALTYKSAQIRPDFAVRPFDMPDWVLTLLAICALASLIGSDSMRFAGKACLLGLMLPYFFSGIALMHEASKTWPNRKFLLFFIYFLMASLFWPVLGLSAVGLWHQVKTLNKHLSSGGSSSKS